jgi:hypothetical protein
MVVFVRPLPVLMAEHHEPPPERTETSQRPARR